MAMGLALQHCNMGYCRHWGRRRQRCRCRYAEENTPPKQTNESGDD
jgi:hypothetical protein